jgi:predicted TPR repeat methyltransferase
MSARTAPGDFEARYRADEDPWDFASAPYEQAKFARSVAALGARRFASGLELGCSIGVLTALLAPRCDRLVALDGAPTAVERARERLVGVACVDVRQGLIPEHLPPGPWELVVASEVLYYLDATLLEATLARIVADLEDDGLLLAVHWTGRAASHRLHADEVHAQLRAHPQLRRVHAENHAGYRLDLLERVPR